MNNKFRLFKHQILITVIATFALVVSMIGGSYALFTSSDQSNEYNVFKVGDLEISYVDNGSGYGDVLSLNGAYPMSDNDGKKTTPYRFNVVNTGKVAADFKIKILYDDAIIAEDGCSGNKLDQKYVKYQFDNETPALLSSKENDGYVVYTATNLAVGESQIHYIRLWLDSSAKNDVLGKHFHGKVVVESVQAGIDDKMLETYAVGEAVTLVDNSKWHVLKDSSGTETTVTLLSDYNLNSSYEYDTTCGKSINDTTTCSPIKFDTENVRLTENNSYCTTPEYGCNMYEKNNSTVTVDSTLKTWLDNNYIPKLKNSLTTNRGTTDDLYVTIPSMDDLAKADGKTFNQSQVSFTKDFLSETNYWTKTASKSNSSYVWYVVGNNSNSYVQYANNDTQIGIRPMIITSKLNIK